MSVPRLTVTSMSAQPLPGLSPDDPAEILRVLPAEYHEAFLAEYGEAVENARRPEHFADLTALLRLWRLRSIAYSDPTFAERMTRAADRTGDIPAEELIPGLPLR